MPSSGTLRISFAAEPDVADFWKAMVAACRRAEGRPLTEWQAAERFVDAFLAGWDLEDPYRYTLEHKILARDGYRCSVPCCRLRRRLHVHHLRWRSRGGDDAPENLAAACSCHHLHGIHDHHVRVSGPAPDGLVWELGVREDGTALLVVGPGEVIARRRS